MITRFRVIGLLAVVFFGILLVLGSAAPPPKPQEPAYQPKFDYTPPSNAIPNSAKVTFAVVNAHYSQREPWTMSWPFNVFSDNLSKDFQEALSAKGFTIRGPFGSYDEMTYPDKKNSDLVLQPDLDVRVEVINPRLIRKVISGNVIQADAVITGRVTLSLRESLSGERMWFKSIEMPSSQPVVCTGRKIYPADKDVPMSAVEPKIILADPDFPRALAPMMEQYYKTVMDYAWKYLDTEEMAMVKKQSQEIRARKVY